MAGDPYKELGVARGASQDDIRKAFRKLAKEFHPDKNPGDTAAEDRFKRVTAAFDILGDEEKRKKFDRGEIDADGREQFRGFGGGGGPRGAGVRGGGRDGYLWHGRSGGGFSGRRGRGRARGGEPVEPGLWMGRGGEGGTDFMI